MTKDAQNQAANPSADRAPEDELTLEDKKGVYARASRRARQKLGLYIHTGSFIFVILLLAVINLLTTPGTLWVLYPFFGWGAALLLHWISVKRPVRVYDNIMAREIALELEHRRAPQVRNPQ